MKPKFLVVMKPKLPYAAQLKTYVSVVQADTPDAARYAAERNNRAIFNNLDPRYAKLTVHAISLDSTITL